MNRMNNNVMKELQQTGVRGLIPLEPLTHGTIKDIPNFNPQQDSELLRKAMKGLGTNEKAITSIIGSRSNNQRQSIKTEFATMYSKNLLAELKSELSANYEKTVLELMMPPAEYDAMQCRDAISGIVTNEQCLIEILSSRSNKDVIALGDAYKRLYEKDLKEDIFNDTAGDFRMLLISLLQGNRSENDPVDPQRAAQDAQMLYKAGEKCLGTDESKFCAILASRSFPQLRLIFNEYDKITKYSSLEEAIKNEMSGNLKEGMMAIVKCANNRPAYFAERLYLSMKGLGTDDKTLIRVMVSRSEIDMVEIKHEFQRMYGKTLETFIAGDCSGDYKKILLQLCAGN